MQKENYAFCMEYKVRDYECDLQGIVNNANYLHYLEHTRHEYLLSRGVSFSGLHQEGVDLLIVRVEIDYISPLKSGDSFIVCLNARREGNVRLTFEQDIYRLPDYKQITHAVVKGAAIKNGRPISPEFVVKKLGL